MTTAIYHFNQLTTAMLYDILQLREQVFIVEQQSIYTDLDGLDDGALHLCKFVDNGDMLIGYCRLRFIEDTAKVERVVVHPDARGQGVANTLMASCIELVKQHAAIKQIGLSAQLAVIPFYQRWGFSEYGEPYDDGGILHKDMLRPLV